MRSKRKGYNPSNDSLPALSDLPHRYAPVGILVIKPPNTVGKTGASNLPRDGAGQTLHHRSDCSSGGNKPARRKDNSSLGCPVSALGPGVRTFAELSSPGVHVGSAAGVGGPWLQSVNPADRAIVATARHLRSPRITADEIIQEGDWVETVWE